MIGKQVVANNAHILSLVGIILILGKRSHDCNGSECKTGADLPSIMTDLIDYVECKCIGPVKFFL